MQDKAGRYKHAMQAPNADDPGAPDLTYLRSCAAHDSGSLTCESACDTQRGLTTSVFRSLLTRLFSGGNGEVRVRRGVWQRCTLHATHQRTFISGSALSSHRTRSACSTFSGQMSGALNGPFCRWRPRSSGSHIRTHDIDPHARTIHTYARATPPSDCRTRRAKISNFGREAMEVRQMLQQYAHCEDAQLFLLGKDADPGSIACARCECDE